MSLHAIHLPFGLTGATGPLRLLSRFLSGPGVVQPDAFKVSASTPTADMNVVVSGSIDSDDIVIQDDSGNIYHGWNTTDEPVEITANNSGVTKTDLLVAYIDTTLVSEDADNPDGTVLAVVRRGTNLTGVPTDAEVLAAINNQPWEPLAKITVGNGVDSINSGNIVDARRTARINGSHLDPGTIASDRMASEGWVQFTPTWSTSGTAPSIGNGTLTGYYRKVGRDVDVQIILKPGSTTTFGSGTWFFAYPVAPNTRYTSNAFVIGDTYAVDTSASKAYGGITQSYDTTRFVPELTDSSNAAYIQGVTPSLPFTWASGDTLSMSVNYEAAP